MPLTPQRAAFFDVDNTLVRGSTSYQFGKEAYRRRFFPRKDFIAFAWHQVVFLTKGETEHMLSAIKDRALGLVKGREYSQMMALVSDVYTSNIKPKVWPETARLAQQHIAAGREVWLITAAPQEMGEEIARALGTEPKILLLDEPAAGFNPAEKVELIIWGPYPTTINKSVGAI